jgi:CubicO group peptidase (beta-lactamase class C family)
MRHACHFNAVIVTPALILLVAVSAAAQPAGARDRAPRRFATESLPPPRFADPDRPRKLAAAFPEIERLFISWVGRQRMPGAVMGLLIDGEMVWAKAAGARDLTGKSYVTPDTVFRIASMTKSFTAMAILKLRDEGKLSLDDPAARFVPELVDLPYPTRDSPAITIRHLLTHSEGFPEDNPWGDRQLAQTDETMAAWMRAGIPFSNAPGGAFEYSNYGFAILGRVVERVSGKPYPDYIRDSILVPLGMRSTTFKVAEVPRDRIALGYRWEGGGWKNEALLAHGSFGAMGGLWTTARDLARYVAFLMTAFPPRNEREGPPISRGSAREMQQAWRAQPALAIRGAVDGPLVMNVSAYGYGLGVSQDCRFDYVVGHGGGLPGYGSLMRWLPEHGVGLIAMGNVTYAGFGGLFNDALAALHSTGALVPRVIQPAPALLTAQGEVSRLIAEWDNGLASRIAADNLFMDESAESRAARFRELSAKHGVCRKASAIEPENALRGKWRVECERGRLDVTITLAPTMPPRVQYLGVESILPPDEETAKKIEAALPLIKKWDEEVARSIFVQGFDLEPVRRRFAAASAWGSCKIIEARRGEGSGDSTARLSCDRGTIVMRLSLDPASRRITTINLIPARDQRCVP